MNILNILYQLCSKFVVIINIFAINIYTLSNVDAGETAPTPVTTVLSLQNLMDANTFSCVVQCYINVCDEVKHASNGELT